MAPGFETRSGSASIGEHSESKQMVNLAGAPSSSGRAYGAAAECHERGGFFFRAQSGCFAKPVVRSASPPRLKRERFAIAGEWSVR